MPDRLLWTAAAWSDSVYWQGQDRKTLKRINALVEDALRHPFEGLGKPEPLRESLAGCWSLFQREMSLNGGRDSNEK